MILRRWKKVPSGHRTGRDLVCVLLKTNTLPIYKFAQVQVDLPVILVLAVDIGADLGLCVFELLLHIRDECTARFTSECTIKQFRTDFGCTSDRTGDAWEFADGIGVEGSKGDGVVVVVEGSKKFFWTCIGFDLGDERIEGGIRIREPSHRWRTGRPCSRREINGSNWRDIELNHKRVILCNDTISQFLVLGSQYGHVYRQGGVFLFLHDRDLLNKFLVLRDRMEGSTIYIKMVLRLWTLTVWDCTVLSSIVGVD